MQTYSFMDVTASLVGPSGVVELGYGAGIAEEGITVAMAEDKNQMVVGSDGEGFHNLSAAKHGQVTVRVLKTSPTNAKLQAMYDAQQMSSLLWGKNGIIVRMPGVGDIHTARGVAFKKKPDMTYAKNVQMNEWVFDCLKIDSVLGLYPEDAG